MLRSLGSSRLRGANAPKSTKRTSGCYVQKSRSRDLHVHICTCIDTSALVYTCIYIERERETDMLKNLQILKCLRLAVLPPTVRYAPPPNTRKPTRACRGGPLAHGHFHEDHGFETHEATLRTGLLGRGLKPRGLGVVAGHWDN